MTRIVVAVALCLLVPVVDVLAQGRPGPPPPGAFDVGNAVLLATNSLQVSRDCVIVSGDLVVNNASIGAIYGEKDLSIDQGITVPAAYSLKANSVDVDAGAVVNGTIYTNELQSNGTITGEVISPVGLPFISTLPPLMPGTAGTQNVTVGNGQTQPLGTGNYGALSVGRDATLRLGGGPYTFTSVNVERGGSIIWDGPGEVVVLGTMSLGSGAAIDNNPSLATKHKMFFVHGSNGTDGALLSTPSAVSIGKDSTVKATILAPNGSIVVGDNTHVVGSLIGKDINVGRGSSLELRSGFRNQPPIAFSQERVDVVGTAAVLITLAGFDPDGDPLNFFLTFPPTNGTLSGLTQTSPTTAVVLYTPSVPSPDDSFGFRVTDAEGVGGPAANAIVKINNGVPPPPPPTTVVVPDTSQDVLQNRPTILTLPGLAPQGVALTFSIVAGSGPSNGTLGPLMQPTQQPPQPARVPYTPASGYTGPDSFVFEACGVISGNTVCDTGTFSLTVVAPPTENGELAPDIAVSTSAGQSTAIDLPTPPAGAGRFVLHPTAAFLQGAEVAGNVADATADGLGDNHNALPGSAPGLMSAGVGQSGGPGSNGTVRMNFEFDISSLGGLADSLQSASVLLHTNRGTVDSADTKFFWVGEDNDGQLTDNDYQRTAEQVGQVVMPVPPNQPIGNDGLFSFDVLSQVRSAMKAGFTHFTLQGRVDETQQGPVRGLQVYTTASGNLTNNLEPALGLATPGVTAPRTYRVLSLPSLGTLRDSNNMLISVSSLPYTLPSSVLLYQAPLFAGSTSFNYEVSDGQTVDTGIVNISIITGDCRTDPRFCDTGRD